MHLRFLSSFKHKVDLKSSHTSSAGGAERGKQRVLRWGGVASTSILISLSAIRGLTENIPDDLFKTLKFPFPSLYFSCTLRLKSLKMCSAKVSGYLIGPRVHVQHDGRKWQQCWSRHKLNRSIFFDQVSDAMLWNEISEDGCCVSFAITTSTYVILHQGGFARCRCPMQTDQSQNTKKLNKQQNYKICRYKLFGVLCFIKQFMR